MRPRWPEAAALLLLVLVAWSSGAQGNPEDSPKYQQGYSDGYDDGYVDGSANGYAQGYTDAFQTGFDQGTASGYADGYASGYADGHAAGFAEGFGQGYDQGLANGTGGGASLDVRPRWAHPAGACSEPYHVQWAGWDLCWQQDDLRVQGLEINRAFFHNASVVWKMGVPFSFTKYERPTGPGPFKDVLGNPYAAGLNGYGRGSLTIDPAACPRFLAFGETTNQGRVCVEYRGGVEPAVALWARYDVFNYRFIQGWEFDSRGEFAPFIRLGGLLYDGDFVGERGQDHNHHVYWRIDFDVAGDGNDVFQAFKQASGEAYQAYVQDARVDTVKQAVRDAAGVDCMDLRTQTPGKAWCDISREALFRQQLETLDKWRVADTEDRNAQGRERSFEVLLRSDAPADHFSTFDAMALQYRGDSAQIGYEAPATPLSDQYVVRYIDGEPITDPVAWFVNHAHHDTRDEERGSMSYHDVRFQVMPRNFLDQNLGEATYP